MGIYEEIAKAVEERKNLCVATIISTKGSTPRHNAKMIVYDDGSTIGTIGGGGLEQRVISDALEAINKGESFKKEYILAKEVPSGLDSECGGTTEIFFEVIKSRLTAVLVGGGHVGYAVSRFLDFLGYDYIVVDDREEIASRERYPGAAELICAAYTEGIKRVRITPSHAVIIATEGHRYDREVLTEVLDLSAFYIGMIGSRRKVRNTMNSLLEAGYDIEKLKRVSAPVGLDLGAETPEEIAVSIVSEMMAAYKGATARPLKEIMGWSYAEGERNNS
ncbi:MAG: XdhC/CoxI family protein [Thermoanaerobacteraceae bacterium]|nr:XdhC/CoxI family protein [Thermoanaerobacteraceae bacterium]